MNRAKSDPVRVLYVDDSPHDQALIRDALEQSEIDCSLTLTASREEFESALEEGQNWDLVLSDFNILGFDGLQVLHQVKEKRPDVPVIIVTGTGSEQIAVEAMRSGAFDYVIKTPSHIRSLPLTIEKTLHLHRMEMEHRQTIEDLKDSEARFRLLAENTLDCIWQMDMNLIFSYINPAVKAMFGFTPDEWIGSRLSDHCDEGPYQQMTDILKDQLADLENHEGIQIETVMRRKDGSQIAVEIRARILLDDKNVPQGLQGVTRDISERKEMEDQQRQKQMELQQAQKMEAVGRLAGGVAHDFNNMLNVILGYSEMAASRLPEDHPVQGNLKRILDAASKSAGLTRQLLAFSRKEEIEPTILNLNEQIENDLKMLNRLIGEHIDLRFEPDPDLWDIRVDTSHVDQILTNLCINARDAISGSGEIRIQTRNATLTAEDHKLPPQMKAGEFVEVAVSDTGCGMDDETRAHVFEPFFTTKAEGKGTGLGLSTVYGIIQQNEGFIHLHSSPGEGTTFFLYFPRCTESCRLKQDAQTDAGFEGNETILIVEDEQEVLDVATRALEMYGYTVLAANRPERGIAVAESHPDPIHLLLTDVVMPGINGRELQQKIRAVRPDINTVFMSGYTADVIEEHGGTGEQEPLIHKPFTIDDLLQKIRSALDSPS